ncbi:hypothetical protein EV426DRAFT_682711 [Tirmania nivea]|nr:hypothetical protein EV426DRAFT_682711 [Tirmania nivea]
MGRPAKQTKWNREALRGLTYVVTDRGPQRWWLHKMGRADDPLCGLCEEGIAQNAAHILSCAGVADGKGRRWEQIWEDQEWCEKLAEAVRSINQSSSTSTPTGGLAWCQSVFTISGLNILLPTYAVSFAFPVCCLIPRNSAVSLYPHHGPTGGRHQLFRSCTVADGEEKGISLALHSSGANKLLILTDSMASKQALSNLSRGAPPRSGIEKEIKDLLHRQGNRETAIGWVRSHIGIPGNEKADRRAAYESALGRIAGTQQVATAAVIRAAAKARRKDMRSEPGFGINRSLWHRHAMAAYTWLRTNRGPQNYWLHFVRKVDSPACPNCDHPSEDGSHITFDCPHHRRQRQELIGNIKTWEELDTPLWRKEEGEEKEWDAVEAYFAYLYRTLAGR